MRKVELDYVAITEKIEEAELILLLFLSLFLLINSKNNPAY